MTLDSDRRAEAVRAELLEAGDRGRYRMRSGKNETVATAPRPRLAVFLERWRAPAGNGADRGETRQRS